MHPQAIDITIGDSCSWLNPTDQDSVSQCVDVTFSNLLNDPEGNKCCNSHQGRSKCPKDLPVMCENRDCAGGNDYCCSATNCTTSGGPRICGIGTYFSKKRV